LGPTGVGKSTLIANMALQDIESGAGVVLVDPKGDLVTDVLARIPEQRRDDVIVLDPAATDRPVGFNLLGHLGGEAARELVADHVVHIMASLWADSWGPRSNDLVRNTVLTLASTTAPDGSAFTLVEVPELLTNTAFRRYVTGQRSVPAVLRSFWHSFEQMSEAERTSVTAAPLNKLRALSTRASLRLLLGQSEGFDLTDLFTKRRIVLVTLSKGTLGAPTAHLIGAVLVASLWQATLRRAAVLPEHRRPAFVYLDEFQDVLRLPLDVADMLAQARGLGVGFTLAHQFLGQLPEMVKAAVLGTARSSVVFQLDHDDARTMERRYAPLTADDLMGQGNYEAALRLSVQGHTQSPVTGHTLPPTPLRTDASELARSSRERYGVPRTAVEEALQTRITPPGSAGAGGRFGRRTTGGRS
jgi:type IV secretory pathway TraG/TraD family ATPase VirD4